MDLPPQFSALTEVHANLNEVHFSLSTTVYDHPTSSDGKGLFTSSNQDGFSLQQQQLLPSITSLTTSVAVLPINNVGGNSSGGSSSNSTNISVAVGVTVGAVFAIGVVIGLLIHNV